MSTVRANSLRPATLGGSDYEVHRAWCVYDIYGITSISDSGNVTSLTDLGVGKPRINLTIALPSLGGAVHNTPGIYDDGRTVPVQTGGQIVATTTVDCRCGSDTIAFNDWQIGSMGVMA